MRKRPGLFRFGERVVMERGAISGGVLDRFSKCLSPCPAAERPYWLRQPLARYLFDSVLRDFLATEAAALAGSK
jgi:hypothetical protein